MENGLTVSRKRETSEVSPTTLSITIACDTTGGTDQVTLELGKGLQQERKNKGGGLRSSRQHDAIIFNKSC